MLMAFERDRPRCHHVQSVTGEQRIDFEVGPEMVDAEEVVDGLPVLAEVRPVEPLSAAALPVVHAPSLPAVQAAAVAATGFVAGAATIALFKRHSARKLTRARLAGRRGPSGLPIVGSRSFLVDVHLIAKPED
jgi:hypothetical protein